MRGRTDEELAYSAVSDYLILSLIEKGPIHGYGLLQAIEKTIGVRASVVSTYLRLRRMEKLGLITSEYDEGRRVYTITERGKQVLMLADRFIGRTQHY